MPTQVPSKAVEERGKNSTERARGLDPLEKGELERGRREEEKAGLHKAEGGAKGRAQSCMLEAGKWRGISDPFSGSRWASPPGVTWWVQGP